MSGLAAIGASRTRELWVGEAGVNSDVHRESRFDIHFADTASGHCVTAAVVLDPEWRGIRGAFVPHELSRAFFSVVFAERPDCVVIESVSGASLECARIAAALGLAVAIRLPGATRLAGVDAEGWRWFGATLAAADVLYRDAESVDERTLRSELPGLGPVLPALPAGLGGARVPSSGFGYEVYAVQRRDHRLLYAMQEPLVAHFAGCARVLDLGCGTGVFLEALRRAGSVATGIERNEFSGRYARALGHEVVCDDALRVLESASGEWDGIYCSHFIEHLPFEAAERLIAATARSLRPGGVALFVFPDPESIRSQLLGFWRDPEHVRFYHPELVATLAERYGLVVEYDSQRSEGRKVVPFGMQPPPCVPEGAPATWVERLLRRIGVVPFERFQMANARIERLEHAVEQLWAVNQTWAWDDNAVLRFRRTGLEG